MSTTEPTQLDTRSHLARPVAITALAGGALCAAGLIVRRLRRRRRSRVENLRKAFQRAAEGKTETAQVSIRKRILGAAGAALASVVVRRLAQWALADRDRTAPPIS